MKQGLLVDYEWCTGCHSCEVACQVKNGLPPEKFGIKLVQIGPWQISEDKWQYSYLPLLSEECNLCGDRVAEGKQPSCVQHCQAHCLHLVSSEEAQQAIESGSKKLFMTL